MNRNKWFKHYNTASQGETLTTLWANNDTEAIALFWLLLELVSRLESDEKRGEIQISWRVIARETGWKPTKCRRVMARILAISKIGMTEEQTGNVSFLIPNWLKLQGTWGGKRESRLSQDVTDLRLKTKDKREKTEDLDTDSKIKRMFSDAGLALPNRLKP